MKKGVGISSPGVKPRAIQFQDKTACLHMVFASFLPQMTRINYLGEEDSGICGLLMF